MSALFDDDPELIARAWVEEQTRIAAAEERVKAAADEQAAVVLRELVAAAFEYDDPEQHIEVMGRIYERLASLHSDVIATMLIAEMWPRAVDEANALVASSGSALADLRAVPADWSRYRGRRRRCECPDGAGDGWRCPSCGGQRVKPGGVT